jgi:hypothetical protein
MMTMAIKRQRTPPVLPLVARHAERLDQNKQKNGDTIISYTRKQ